MKYTITNKKILYALNELIIYGILSFGIVFYLKYEFDDIAKNMFVVYGLLLLFYLVVVFIPVIRLFLNYYDNNKNTIIVLNDNEIVINENPINVLNIKHIDVFANKMHFGGEGGSLPHQGFYYLKVVLKNNTSHILTSLLNHKIIEGFKEKYPDLDYIENVRTYPLIEE